MQNGELYNPHKVFVGIFIPKFDTKSQKTSLLTERKEFHDAYIRQIVLTFLGKIEEEGRVEAWEYMGEKIREMVSGEIKERILKIIR